MSDHTKLETASEEQDPDEEKREGERVFNE
jgi:hypothetical protein